MSSISREEKRKAKEEEELKAKKERNAMKRAYNQARNEKIKANTDKKAIQRAYEASNPILQEERKAYRETKNVK